MEPAWREGMFSGSLQQMDVAEVCRLLSASSQTGALHFAVSGSQRPMGEVYFQLGQMVDAAFGALVGLDALQELCRWPEADFYFEEGVVAPRQSLAAYPTEKLIDQLRKLLDEAKLLRLSMPGPEQVPEYVQGRSIAELRASPDDLKVLLLCNGQRTVRQIVMEAGRSAEQVQLALARFRQAALVEFRETQMLQAVEPVPAPSGEAPEAAVPEKKAVHYWRGKPVG